MGSPGVFIQSGTLGGKFSAFSAAETPRNDGTAHQCTTFTQKPPARCRDKVVAGVGWLGHHSYSARNRHAWNNPTKLGYVPGGRRLDYSYGARRRLPRVAAPVPILPIQYHRENAARRGPHRTSRMEKAASLSMRPFLPIAPGFLLHLILGARSLALVPATV